MERRRVFLIADEHVTWGWEASIWCFSYREILDGEPSNNNNNNNNEFIFLCDEVQKVKVQRKVPA